MSILACRDSAFDFGLSEQCRKLWLLETALLIFSTRNNPANFRYLEKLYRFFLYLGQRFRLWFVETILPTLLDETNLLTFVCQCTDKLFFDRLTREEITGGITVD